MPDLPQAHVCHVTPNRLRLRVSERRHDTAFFDAVRSRLSEWGSVERVTVNPTAGSVVIHFSNPVDLLAEHSARNDLFTLADTDPRLLLGTMEGSAGDGSTGVSLAEQVRQGFASVNRTMRRWTGGQEDFRSVIFLGLFGAGIVQLLRGNMTAPAVTLFWYAGDALRLWDTLPPDTPPPGTPPSTGAAAGKPVPGNGPAASGD
jgi:hypothetical protein